MRGKINTNTTKNIELSFLILNLKKNNKIINVTGLSKNKNNPEKNE